MTSEPEPGQRAYERHGLRDGDTGKLLLSWRVLTREERLGWANQEKAEESRGGATVASEPKSLGQVGYESWQLPTGSYRSAAEWDQERADVRARYQAQAEAVREEVLRRELAGSAAVADAQEAQADRVPVMVWCQSCQSPRPMTTTSIDNPGVGLRTLCVACGRCSMVISIIRSVSLPPEPEGKATHG